LNISVYKTKRKLSIAVEAQAAILHLMPEAFPGCENQEQKQEDAEGRAGQPVLPGRMRGQNNLNGWFLSHKEL
jgi:hypothetical protein